MRRASRARVPFRPRRTPLEAEVLLLDCGNSRVKWARARLPYERGRPFLAIGSIDMPALKGARRPLSLLLGSIGTDTRILVCNVAGHDVQRRIQFAAERAQRRAPTFVRTLGRAAGVRNGYSQPWRLGVDRWVALIGAHHEYPDTSLCLVGAGSAMTIDLLAAGGAHRGGCIIPGPRMMIESLLLNTAGIRRRAQLSGHAALTRALAEAAPRPARARALFTHDTRSALLAGAHFACAALIELAMAAATQRLGRSPRLLLTGGAAAAIGPLLRVAHHREDDLVLRGLAVLAGAR